MTRSDDATGDWLGDASVPWNILLAATLRDVPSRELLLARLADLSEEQGWPAPSYDAVGDGEVDALLAAYAEVPADAPPVSVGRTPQGLVVRAHHAYVDGLGLLAVLARLVDHPVTSGARGVGERAHRHPATTLASRLAEVGVRPPAAVAGTPGGSGDVFAEHVLERSARTADLVHAGARAVRAWNGRVGLRGTRIAVAVGVSTTGGHDLRVGDHSGFLRLTGVERLGRAEVDRALAEAPLQLGGTARTATARRAGGVIRWASRTFAPRLGSTLLVSHLGRVGSEVLTGATFHPFAGTGSGVSLGAVTVEGRTTLTMRARGATHSEADLRALLALVVDQL